MNLGLKRQKMNKKPCKLSVFNLKISWPLDHLYPYDEFDERKTPHFWVIKDFLHSCLLRSGCRSSRFLQMIQVYSVLSVVEQNASGLKERSTSHIFENDFFFFKDLFQKILSLLSKSHAKTVWGPQNLPKDRRS